VDASRRAFGQAAQGPAVGGSGRNARLGSASCIGCGHRDGAPREGLRGVDGQHADGLPFLRKQSMRPSVQRASDREPVMPMTLRLPREGEEMFDGGLRLGMRSSSCDEREAARMSPP